MKTVILSRETLRNFFCLDTDYSNHALIEILDVDNTEEISFPDDLRYITLRFDDIFDLDFPDAMKEEHAQKIVSFINDFKDSIDTLIVSCTHGVSRSAAVAAAIVFSLGKDDWYIWEDFAYGPNPFCYKLILEAFGTDTSLVNEKYLHNCELVSILYNISQSENGVKIFEE